jgi:ankyrin repeat protein
MPTIEDLRIALEASDAETAERLLVENPDLANDREKTPPPLRLMVWCNLPKMVELLLDHGADVESRDQGNDTTPVRYAIVYERKEMIRLLAQGGSTLLSHFDYASVLTVAMLLPRGPAGRVSQFRRSLRRRHRRVR